MKIAILTLGCRANQAESSQIEGSLTESGHQIVGLSESPDLCIINTCTVTGKSDYQSRQLIRRAHRQGAEVLVTGCYAELNIESISRMEGVRAVYGTREKHRVLEGLGTGHPPEGLPVTFGKSRSRITLKIQDGCNSSCSYCLIPRARGASRSVPRDKVILEAREALERGFRELVLSGIHIGYYGRDLEPSIELSDLVEDLLGECRRKQEEGGGLRRLRLSSIEVNEVTPRLVELFDDPGLCDHLHIPLQAGSDKTLKDMRRGYTLREFEAAIRRIKDRRENLTVGSDIIAGFPGETEALAREAERFVLESPVDYLHVFPYSERPGTPAAEMPGAVAKKVRKERAARLREISREKYTRHLENQVGRELEVLFEEEVTGGQLQGTSSNYIKVRVERSGGFPEGVGRVLVEGVSGGILAGRFIPES